MQEKCMPSSFLCTYKAIKTVTQRQPTKQSMRKSKQYGDTSFLLVMQQHHSSKTSDSICHEVRDTMKKPLLLHRVSKRLFDLFFSFVGIVIISPIFLAVLILQWLTTSGTPFFRQERIGKGGKPFHIIKFRTIELNAEADGPQLVNINNSTRFTRCGQFLRKHHLRTRCSFGIFFDDIVHDLAICHSGLRVQLSTTKQEGERKKEVFECFHKIILARDFATHPVCL